MIRSQLIAEMGNSIAVVRAYREKGGISGKIGISDRVGISSRVGIKASSSKDIFRPSIIYNKGVGE